MANYQFAIHKRICAVTDVFDALVSERPYKNAFTNEQAFEIIAEGRGQHFDPLVGEVFLKHRSAILEIQAEHSPQESEEDSAGQDPGMKRLI